MIRKPVLPGANVVRVPRPHALADAIALTLARGLKTGVAQRPSRPDRT